MDVVFICPTAGGGISNFDGESESSLTSWVRCSRLYLWTTRLIVEPISLFKFDSEAFAKRQPLNMGSPFNTYSNENSVMLTRITLLRFTLAFRTMLCTCSQCHSEIGEFINISTHFVDIYRFFSRFICRSLQFNAYCLLKKMGS